MYYDFQSFGITDTYQGIILAHIGMGGELRRVLDADHLPRGT